MEAVGPLFAVVSLDIHCEECSRDSIGCFLNEWTNDKKVHVFSKFFSFLKWLIGIYQSHILYIVSYFLR